MVTVLLAGIILIAAIKQALYTLKLLCCNNRGTAVFKDNLLINGLEGMRVMFASAVLLADAVPSLALCWVC